MGVIGNQFGLRRGNELRCISDAWNNIGASFGHDGGILCLLHRLAELFYRVSWMKLMQILKGTGTDWREIRLISWGRNYFFNFGTPCI